MKNYRPGKPIKSLNELKKLRVVYVPWWDRTSPVSFFLGWQWRMIDGWVRNGHICRAVKIKRGPRGARTDAGR